MKKIVWSTAMVLAGASASFGAFIPGTISIVRVGDGSMDFTSAYLAQSVFVDTYDAATGTLLGTAGLPGSVLSSKNDDADGHISFTGNGQYLTLGAYASTPGAAYPVTANVPRSVVRIDGSGNVATASWTGIYAGQTITAVASVDGNSFFTVGGNDTAGSGGLRYVPSLSAPSTVNVSQTQTGSKADSFRSARIVNGQLYINTASQGSFVNRGVYAMTINGGLPVASVNTASTATPIIVDKEGSTIDNAGNVSPDTTGKLYPKTDSAFIDTNGDGQFDLAYSTGGKDDLEKWAYSGGNWLRTDIIDAPAITIDGQNNEINAIDYQLTSSGVELYLSNDFGIWKFLDAGGLSTFASSDITSGLDVDENGRHYLTSNYFISAASDEQFRGLALYVPEPGAALLAGVAGLSLSLRRRRLA